MIELRETATQNKVEHLPQAQLLALTIPRVAKNLPTMHFNVKSSLAPLRRINILN
jgi:hypothetical protein